MTATQVPERTEQVMRSLLEAGVHFGHQTKRWDPRMSPYIFGERDGIHIIDLHQTALLLAEAREALADIAEGGGKIVYVGTKKQAQEIVKTESERCGMFYVNRRWLGGTLTNFRTIRERIQHLRRLEQQKEAGAFEVLPRQEALARDHEYEKLERNLGGLKHLNVVPRALIVIDPRREAIAIKEANRLDIPIFAICDSNCNPDAIDYPIPGNDDAIRSIRLIISELTDGIIEGLTRAESAFAEDLPAQVEGEVEAEAQAQAEDSDEPGEESDSE